MENGKKIKKTKKIITKKNGFTLIELLAVIIILGILMIIAIPSVTNYINDSRKSAYIDTAKNIVSGARNRVNEGKLGMYDTNVTYYLPYEMISSENAKKSPYGDFVEAYVAVTYDGQGYDYYWTSIDDAKIGIYLTYNDLLDNDDIVADMDGITTDIGIGNRERIIVFDKDGRIASDHLVGSDNNISEEGKYSGTTSSNGYTGYAYIYNEFGNTSIGETLENIRKTMWCPILNSGETEYCATYGGYDTKDECLSYIQGNSNYSCVSREVLYDEHLLTYEMNAITTARAYYLKIYMVNDNIKRAWGCVRTDSEHCFEGGDASFYASNVDLLRSIESHFSNCNIGSYESKCDVNNLYYVDIWIRNDGYVSVGTTYASCYVGENKYVTCPYD